MDKEDLPIVPSQDGETLHLAPEYGSAAESVGDRNHPVSACMIFCSCCSAQMEDSRSDVSWSARSRSRLPVDSAGL